MNRFLLILSVFVLNVLYLIRTTCVEAEGLRVKSIDTMKYSRDLAREKLEDQSFDKVIDRQLSLITETGATHVAIGTPYDAEFLPFLRRWVASARKHNLKVWFRGNLSGWEGWFDYAEIDRSKHTAEIVRFIRQNRQLFADGDIFTSCPECENGGPESVYEDVESHKEFLISEYRTVKNEFYAAGKNVTANYYSMNGDIAGLVMDRDTTTALDGIVTVDHYVESPDRLKADLEEIARTSGGKIVLGEFGAPVPDIHGRMTARQQAEWLAYVLAGLNSSDEVIGFNYWVNSGGSTALWTDAGIPREAVTVLTNAYKSNTVKGKVAGPEGMLPGPVNVTTLGQSYPADRQGVFTVPLLYSGQKLRIEAEQFRTDNEFTITDTSGKVNVALSKPTTGSGFRLLEFIFSPLRRLRDQLGI